MNIVKAEEYAKTLPIGKLKEYADGLNPNMIPQWLATGVMEAKTKQAELVDQMEAANSGEQPTIKDKVEQKAGLMALQQAQQAQGAQQMPPMGGPVPEGAPQPTPQPQPGEAMPPETFMAARGGLAQLPSHLHFDGGGIVAFAGPGGSAVKAGPEFLKFLQQMGIDYIEYSKMAPAIQDNIKEAFREVGTRAPQAAAQAAQAAPAAAAAAQNQGAMYNAARTAGKYGTKAVKGMGLPGILASGVENFGDYKLKSDDDIDTSASGTFNDLKRGNIGRAAKGLGMGLGELVADAGSAVANTADYVVPGKAPVSSAYDKLLRSTGLFKDKPEGEDVQQANMASENARLAAKAPSAGTPIGNEGRRTGPIAEGVNPNANPNLVPANVRPQVKPQPRPQGGLPNLQQGPAAPPAAAAPTGPMPGSAEAMALEAVKDKEKPMTLEEAIAQRRQAESAFGLDKPAGLAKLARADEMDAAYKAAQPDSLDNLIRTFGRAGQFKGLSGTGSAYTATQDENRARQMAHLEKMNTLRGGVEDTQRAESTAGMTGATATLDKSKQQAADLNKERMNSLAQMAGKESQERSSKYSADSSANASKYTADMHYKSAMAQAAMADRRAGAAEKRAVIDSFKLRINSINAELVPLEKNPFLKENKAAIQRLQAEKEGLNKALDEHSGISKMTGAPGAVSPGGNTRIRFDASGNQIK
jgi:hypothetical protein